VTKGAWAEAEAQPQLTDSALSGTIRVIEQTFRNAIIDGREVTQWVINCRTGGARGSYGSDN
jgi:hypothetical protein